MNKLEEQNLRLIKAFMGERKKTNILTLKNELYKLFLSEEEKNIVDQLAEAFSKRKKI